jgi:ABC-type glycerol-3-phosphate transport system substrate-binding protein
METVNDLRRCLRTTRLRVRAVGLLAALLAAATAGAAATTAAPSTAPGTWQTHELEFQFIGFTTTYSCDGLEEKLRLLLGRLGARPDYSVEGFGCSRGPGMPDAFARARLKFASLAPAADGAAAPVDGVWKPVSLAPQRPYPLEAGDCELVEQFRDKLLPLFTTRAVQNQVTCVPHQTPASFSLSFEVFAPPAKR